MKTTHNKIIVLNLAIFVVASLGWYFWSERTLVSFGNSIFISAFVIFFLGMSFIAKTRTTGGAAIVQQYIDADQGASCETNVPVTLNIPLGSIATLSLSCAIAVLIAVTIILIDGISF